MPSPRGLIIIYIIICSFCFLAQSAGQSLIAKGTLFGSNVGWQTEIAFWNLGLVLVLIAVLRSNKGIERDIIPGLAVLIALFAINHFIAAINSSASPLDWRQGLTPGIINWGVGSANSMGALFSAIIYFQSKPSKIDA